VVLALEGLEKSLHGRGEPTPVQPASEALGLTAKAAAANGRRPASGKASNGVAHVNGNGNGSNGTDANGNGNGSGGKAHARGNGSNGVGHANGRPD
jgi:hypothetical protein